MSDRSFSEPRRQAPLGVIILFGENLRKMIQIVAALVFATLYMEELPISRTWIIFILGLIMAIFTVLQYLRFTFHISSEELIIEKGVLIKERLSIPLERIQTVHLSQNILQQIFQVTGLKIDTAGSGKEELKISALTHGDAKELQDLLQKESVNIQQENLSDSAAHEIKPENEQRETLVHLSLGQLILVGLTENHIRSGLIAVGVLWGYYWQFKDMMQEGIVNQTQFDPNELESALIMSRPGLGFVMMLILFFLIASVMVSMFRTILKHFNLKATLGKKSLQVSSGLLKRNEYSIPLNKIQIMTWQGNVLRDIPGFESVIIKQSRSDDSSGKQKVEIPACIPEQTMTLETRLFSDELDKEMRAFKPHAYYLIFLRLVFGIIGMIPTVLIYLSTQVYWVFAAYLVYVFILFFWTKKYVSKVKISTNGELLRYEKGWLSRDRSLVKIYKIQSVKYSQSIFQKRRGTAHLTLYTAGGSMRIPFLPAYLASEMYNYFLYKVEVSEKGWM